MSKNERKNKKQNVANAKVIDKVVKESTEKTVNGYKMQGSHVILTPNQLNAFEVTYNSLVANFEAVNVELPNELNLDSHIITSLKGITSLDVKTFQTGADRSSNLTDNQKDVLKQIKSIIENNADAVIGGKYMYVGTDDVPRELSCTFTLRTPPDTDRKTYVKKVQDQIANIKSETEEVVNK